ncbi:MAG: sigma-54 dependent transcriptional regulator, partial [Acidobacteria bacterium]|nr:sigma-54 dependent transcriptional regulator [Acidobacteriota bacterium]MDW7985184.1 sigma-54 dependent transcriptional regulator [Acidobacteriota bacterium]
EGYQVWVFGTGTEAIEFLKQNIVDLFIIDIRLPDMDGITLLRAIRENDPYLPVIVITAYASLDTALEALRMHARDYLIKPFDLNELVLRVRRCLEEYQLWRENRFLRQQVRQLQMPSELVFESPVMKSVLDLVHRIAMTPHTVLITGESGVGKEVIARLIHETSHRTGPFVSINCAAVPATLLETELFGHVKGAFTGAVAHKKGLFEVANGGTLLLDEIGELPLEVQPKLLRAIEHRTIRPIGATHEVEVDVRLIAATNQDLQARVQSGQFREDLFYRLHVFHVRVPPLRERREDILPLAEMFLRKHGRLVQHPIRRLAPETQRVFLEYPWPGNVRELENTIVRAVLMETHDELHPHALPPEILHKAVGIAIPASLPDTLPEGLDLDAYVEQVRRRFIEQALRRTRGSRKRAAEILQIPLRSLKYYMRKYGLSARQFRT